MRWLLLDEILSIQKKEVAKAQSRIPQAEYSSELLLVEMMAQTGALLLGAESDFKEDVIFAKIERAEFGRLLSGEKIEIEAKCENLRSEGSWFEAQVKSEKGTLAKARFLLMNVGHIIPGSTEPISFHENFMNHFKVREKIK